MNLKQSLISHGGKLNTGSLLYCNREIAYSHCARQVSKGQTLGPGTFIKLHPLLVPLPLSGSHISRPKELEHLFSFAPKSPPSLTTSIINCYYLCIRPLIHWSFWVFLVSGPEDHFLRRITAHLPAEFLQRRAGDHQTVCRELREGPQRSRPGAPGTLSTVCLVAPGKLRELLWAFSEGDFTFGEVSSILVDPAGGQASSNSRQNFTPSWQCLEQKIWALASVMGLDQHFPSDLAFLVVLQFVKWGWHQEKAPCIDREIFSSSLGGPTPQSLDSVRVIRNLPVFGKLWVGSWPWGANVDATLGLLSEITAEPSFP